MIHLGIRTKLKNKYQEIKPVFYHNFLYYMPKKYAHKKLYKTIFQKDLDLSNPKDFNEKLHYLMVYKYGKKEARLTDKILVKDYIQQKNIKGLKIPKTLKIYSSVTDISLEELPNQFVLKCNHGSGGVVICTNKNSFDLENHLKELNYTLHENFAKKFYEYHYRYIKPCIYAEEYLDDSTFSKNPIDYKVYCVNGKAKSILVCSERETSLKLSEYDLNWKRLDYITDEFNSQKDIPKPKKLKDILRIAEELADDIPFVRVDLYEIKNQVFFGELTFTPAGGVCNYYNEKGMKVHGDYIDLNLYDKKKKSS